MSTGMKVLTLVVMWFIFGLCIGTCAGQFAKATELKLSLPEAQLVLWNTGDISFMANGKETLRITAGGDFVVHGRVIQNDKENYARLRHWIQKLVRE